MARRKDAEPRLLTEAELVIMKPVWQLGSASVRETLEGLDADHQVAYTTVATMLKILETKGFLKGRKHDGVLRYTPRITREAYEAVSLRHLVTNVFEGTPAALVNRLLEDEEWSREELRALRDRLQRLVGGHA